MGDFSVSGLKVTAQYGSNTDAKEIPPGAGFEIHAEGTVINLNPGFTAWTICMTIWDITHNKAIDHHNKSHSHGASEGFGLARNLVMPPEATRYRVKIFATQNMTSQAPDKTRW